MYDYNMNLGFKMQEHRRGRHVCRCYVQTHFISANAIQRVSPVKAGSNDVTQRGFDYKRQQEDIIQSTV